MGFVTGVVSFAIWVYFWAVFSEVAAFMVNLGPFLANHGVLPAATSNALFPWSLDRPGASSQPFDGPGLLTNVLLLGFFAIPHSLFARPVVKNVFGDFGGLYRSLYVLQSSYALHMLMKNWVPLESNKYIWNFEHLGLVSLVPYLFFAVFTITALFAIDHFELLGVFQTTGLQIIPATGGAKLITRWHYGMVRHPIMTGMLGLMLLPPSMTFNHAFFSASCVTYILGAVYLLEEPDLIKAHGATYKQYMDTTPGLCPFSGGSGETKFRFTSSKAKTK